jgi:hypothetical protein
LKQFAINWGLLGSALVIALPTVLAITASPSISVKQDETEPEEPAKYPVVESSKDDA